jgi:ketosteroid isomerase-like protein
MSQENVEIVRRAVGSFNRGDLEAALDDWAPDAVWDWSNSHGFDAGVFRGHNQIRGFWQQFLDTFDELRFELDEIVEVEEGLLIAENVGYVQGRDGIEAQARSAWLIRAESGQITSLTMYQSKQEALEAAGLRE